jgi:hypothetical protein
MHDAILNSVILASFTEPSGVSRRVIAEP